MAKKLSAGIIKTGRGQDDICWNILGQLFYPKTINDSCFAFEALSAPGDFFPVHVHGAQDKYFSVVEGVVDMKLDGQWLRAMPGDLVRVPRGVPHGFFNRSDAPARTLVWLTPAASLEILFEKLDGLKDVNEVIRLSALYDLTFLPPEANE